MRKKIDDDETLLEDILIEEDTLIKISGMPFWLKSGTIIEGVKSNFDLIKDNKLLKEINHGIVLPVGY
jgi:hypothetical protein